MNRLLGQTTAVCPVCQHLAPGRLAESAGGVALRTFCREHGEHERRIHSDVSRWLAEEHYVKPAWIPRQHAGDAAKPCPEGCGHCQRHEQHLCMPIIEITSRCDLACPICIADAGRGGEDMSEAAFAGILDRLLATEGQIDILNLSGGEPLLHPRLLALIDLALARPGIVRVSISTNGLRLLSETGLTRELARRRVTVSLQCDGLDDTVTLRLRGRAMAEAKRRILDLLAAEDCSTSLVATLARGINEGSVRELLDLLFDRGHVVSLMLQPLAYAGRARSFPGRDDRLDASACIRLLGEAGHPAVAASDFVPLPCSHPRCFNLAFYLVAGPGRAVAINQLLGADRLLDVVANRTVFGLDPDEFRTMQDLLYELWSGPCGQAPDLQPALAAVRSLLRQQGCCFDPREVFATSEKIVKSIFLHGFQDPDTFDLARLRRCCNAYVLADGRMVPCCAHNVLGGRESHA